MEILTQAGGIILSRWAHYLAGVTWIGLLYYFNFVQTPAFAGFEAGARTEAIQKLVPRALWWFRWGAALTLLSGLSILGFQEQFDADYFASAGGTAILTGALMATIMFLNVWVVIWPNQKIVIANAERTAAGQEALPNAASAARKGACASRTNTLFSIPMLFFMGAASHFSPGAYETDASSRTIYWVIFAVVVLAIEGIALSSPAAGKPLAWHIDQHRNTLIGGFAWAIVLILLSEILF
jgi:uncharacterized membrane protein